MNDLTSHPDVGGLLNYMGNAYGRQPYDFKRTNGTNNVIYENVQDFYRGMPINLKGDNLPVYVSARDIGNIGAGLAAGFNDMEWEVARAGFDALQSAQQFKLATEMITTQSANF